MSLADDMRGHVLVCCYCCRGFPVAVRGSPGWGVIYAMLGVALRRCGVTIIGKAGIGHECGYLTVVARERGCIIKNMIG
jgi:hypothetical protein